MTKYIFTLVLTTPLNQVEMVRTPSNNLIRELTISLATNKAPKTSIYIHNTPVASGKKGNTAYM